MVANSTPWPSTALPPVSCGDRLDFLAISTLSSPQQFPPASSHTLPYNASASVSTLGKGPWAPTRVKEVTADTNPSLTNVKGDN